MQEDPVAARLLRGLQIASDDDATVKSCKVHFSGAADLDGVNGFADIDESDAPRPIGQESIDSTCGKRSMSGGTESIRTSTSRGAYYDKHRSGKDRSGKQGSGKGRAGKDKCSVDRVYVEDKLDAIESSVRGVREILDDSD
jgi:hypothetical protein